MFGAVDTGPQATQFAWVHTDRLGTPVAVTSSPGAGNAATIWRASYESFGMATVSEDPDGDLQGFAMNLRLLGQRWDGEGAVHDNFYRTFDPRTGRYLEADPIGVLGGPNAFVYARNVPVGMTDRLGLFGTWDFLKRYFIPIPSAKKGVDLANTDLGGVFEASESVRRRIGEFDALLNLEAQKAARQVCATECETSESRTTAFSRSSTSTTSVRNEPGLFSVGGSAFFRSGSCHVSVNCSTGEYEYTCSTSYGVQDEFTDPLDGKEIFDVPFEVPPGTPYAITWSQQRKTSGRGHVR
jgi:RHS repeat-associated protein